MAGRGFLLLAHAGPNVGVDDVGALDRLARIRGEIELGTDAHGLRANRRARFVALWTGDSDLHAEEVRTEDPRVRHVEARVAEKGRSEEHTSELQSQSNLVCRPLLE